MDSTAGVDMGSVDILIVGSGFAGLIMALRVQQRRLGTFLLLEKGHDLGGTWRDNTYPGAASDVPSHLYSISFEPKADWPDVYARQPEIQAYLQDVARRRGLAAHLRCGQALRSAVFDETISRWTATTACGTRYTAKVLVSAIGALHLPAIPRLPGLDRFRGAVFHSARWDHARDLTGQRVAVVGTGASAVQLIPAIAPRAGRLLLFQRTAAWVMPKTDRPIGPTTRRLLAAVPGLRRAWRGLIYRQHELQHTLFTGQRLTGRIATALARRHLRRQVADPALRAALTPDYRIGCKRILQSNDFYPAMARANAALVTSPIREVTAGAIVTADGHEHPVDTIVFATGFHTTDSFDALHLVGRGGRTLSEVWRDGMGAHLGTTIAGFPNFFMLLGPHTGLGHNSVVLMIEAQVDYVAQRLDDMRERRLDAIEVRRKAQDAFLAEMARRLATSVWQAGGCKSWYQDANGRNTTLWPGTVGEFRRRLRRAGLEDFEQWPTGGSRVKAAA